MAHTKAKATTKNNRDSRPKYLGVKLHSGQIVKPGDIIVRQRGTRFVAGLGTKQGNDDTIFSTQNGRIEFISKNKIKLLPKS